MQRPLMNPSQNCHIRSLYFYGRPQFRVFKTVRHWLLFPKTIYELTDDWTCTFSLGCWSYHITAKAGTLIDFASTPCLIHIFYPPISDEYDCAALLHDLCYMAEIFPRRFADELLLHAMKCEDSSRFTRNVFYAAVRHWGWLTYCGHTRQSVETARRLISASVYPLFRNKQTPTPGGHTWLPSTPCPEEKSAE